MGRGNGGTRSTDKSHGKRLTPLEAYEQYTEGGGVHNEHELTAMDKLFSPAKENMTLYRGGNMEELESLMKENGVKLEDYGGWKDYSELEGRTLKNKHYQSSTKTLSYAEEYASDSYSMIDLTGQDHTPVVFELRVKKGTPIIKRSDYTHTMARGASQEHTIKRNVKWKILYVTERYNAIMDHDEYYVTVEVSK